MFLHASAILSLLLEDGDHDVLLRRLEASRTPPATSPMAVFECVAGLSARADISTDQASDIVSAFMTALKVRNISITPEIGAGAIRAYAAYGKRHGVPAGLNMGDCFAYACAKNYGLPLLSRGNGFNQTDLRSSGD